MSVDARSRETLVRVFRRGGSVHAAALEAGVSDEEASDVLRAEGFDLETRDWFFESAAAFYRRTWARLRRSRERALRLLTYAFDRIPGARRAGRAVARWLDAFERWIVAWSGRSPVKKSVASLVLASVFLTAYWLVDPEAQGLAALLFLGSFSMGAGLLYVHTRSPRLLGSSGVVLLASAAYALTDRAALNLRALDAVLVAEALRASLVPVVAWAFLDAIQQATGFLEKLRVHVPVVSKALVLGLFLAGTAVAYAELYLVTAYTSDPSEVRFVARYGLSYLLWAVASGSLVFTHAYLLYLASLTSMGRVTTRRIVLGTVTGILLFGFVAANAVAIAAAYAGPRPSPMRVGIVAGDVAAAWAGPWDPFVHLDVSWENVETSPGVMNWSYFDAQFDRADREGIEVYLLLGTGPPPWFAAAHRDAAMTDQAGRVFYWIDEDPRVEARRVWDLSFADESVVSAKVAFARVAAARYANRPSVVAVSIQNEPTWPSDFDVFRMASYDVHTQAAFRDWLRDAYTDLATFNDAHATGYEDWADVGAPAGIESPLWADWLRFREDLLVSFVGRLTTAVREVTSRPVTVKIMAHYLTRYIVVQTGLTERVLDAYVNASDVVSVDLYPLMQADLRRSLVHFQALARGKPLWIAEFNFFLGCAQPGSGSSMYTALVEMSRYAERVILFTWEPHYLYGVRLYPSVPGLVGVRMFRDDRDGGSPLSRYGALLAADLGAVPNLYGSYVLVSLFANLPVLPWPALLLLLVPVPSANVERKRRIRKALRWTAVGIFVIGLVLSNVGLALQGWIGL